MSQPLDLEGYLTLTHNNCDVTVEAKHDQVVVRLPDLRTGMALLAQYPARSRIYWLKVLPVHLQSLQLTVSIEFAGKTLARLGNQVRSSWLARCFNLQSVDLRPIALVWTWMFHRQLNSN